MSAIVENSSAPTGLEKVSFYFNTKERQCQKMFKLLHNYTISHSNKIMFKLSKLQQYIAESFHMYKLDLENAEEPETKLLTSSGLQKKQWNSRKNIYLCFIKYTKAFDCMDHNKLWKILKEIGIPEHLPCLLRNMHVG